MIWLKKAIKKSHYSVKMWTAIYGTVADLKKISKMLQKWSKQLQLILRNCLIWLQRHIQECAFAFQPATLKICTKKCYILWRSTTIFATTFTFPFKAEARGF